MKKIFATFTLFFLGVTSLYADVALPKQCEAYLPKVLRKALLSEKEVNELVKSSDFGQNESNSNGDFWDVYSDRSNNATYTSPKTTSAKHETLDFRQPLRIAKIENGFALVYEEPKNVQYPLISS